MFRAVLVECAVRWGPVVREKVVGFVGPESAIPCSFFVLGPAKDDGGDVSVEGGGEGAKVERVDFLNLDRRRVLVEENPRRRSEHAADQDVRRPDGHSHRNETTSGASERETSKKKMCSRSKTSGFSRRTPSSKEITGTLKISLPSLLLLLALSSLPPLFVPFVELR